MKKLKDKTREAAINLNRYLLDHEVIKEYQRYAALLKDHPELGELEARLKSLQQEITLAKVHDEPSDDLMAEYAACFAYFQNHPLIVNYMNYKEEVNNLLIEIETLINSELEKTID